MNPPGLVFAIESAAAALTPALPRRGAGFLRQGFAAFGAGRQGRRRYNTSPQPVLPVPVTKEPRVLCPAGDASGSAATIELFLSAYFSHADVTINSIPNLRD